MAIISICHNPSIFFFEHFLLSAGKNACCPNVAITDLATTLWLHLNALASGNTVSSKGKHSEMKT
jgi:hypothetical protein